MLALGRGGTKSLNGLIHNDYVAEYHHAHSTRYRGESERLADSTCWAAYESSFVVLLL